jgi:hypothetical protein
MSPSIYPAPHQTSYNRSGSIRNDHLPRFFIRSPVYDSFGRNFRASAAVCTSGLTRIAHPEWHLQVVLSHATKRSAVWTGGSRWDRLTPEGFDGAGPSGRPGWKSCEVGRCIDELKRCSRMFTSVEHVRDINRFEFRGPTGACKPGYAHEHTWGLATQRETNVTDPDDERLNFALD